MRFRLAPATVARVDVRLNGLSNASRVSKITVSPGLACATSGMSGCQRLWQVRTGSSAHGIGTPPAPRVTGMRTVFANEGTAAAATSAPVMSTLFMDPSPERESRGRAASLKEDLAKKGLR